MWQDVVAATTPPSAEVPSGHCRHHLLLCWFRRPSPLVLGGGSSQQGCTSSLYLLHSSEIHKDVPDSKESAESLFSLYGGADVATRQGRGLRAAE